MGLLDRMRWAVSLGRGDGARGAAAPPWQNAALASPFGGSSSSLAGIVLADVFGLNEDVIPVTRDLAMRVPGVVKSRALIAGTLSRFPLKQYTGALEDPAQPAWLSRTDTGQSPQVRMLWTLDDLLFYGTSLWATQRDSSGQIVDALRIPWDEWELTDDLEIIVQGAPARADEVLYFEGPQEGLLDIAAGDVRASLGLKRAWSSRVRTPVPLMALRQTVDSPLTSDERKELANDWDVARRQGGTASLPFGWELDTPGADSPADLFVEGRNAERIDWANYTNLPVAVLDGSPATASLTYSVKGDARAELVDISLVYWAAPIAARLSLDDVTPAGTRIDFDITWLSGPEPGTANPAAGD
ncbi:MAG: hypothetical protein FWF90_15670 [Promicromonosporaceae bacterium]|nr:hypothetical protein [Promicromonosporaceae bacterium]